MTSSSLYLEPPYPSRVDVVLVQQALHGGHEHGIDVLPGPMPTTRDGWTTDESIAERKAEGGGEGEMRKWQELRQSQLILIDRLIDW